MPWVIGIDEAGYGPNLGPLVQAAVALSLPADDLSGWLSLKPRIRRVSEPDDGRLLVDDSKAIFSRNRSMEDLARGLLPFPRSVAAMGTDHLLDDSIQDYHEEYYACLDPGSESEPGSRLEFGPRRINLVMPRRFNRIVDETDSKAVVLMRGFIALIQSTLERLPGGDAVVIHGDKHGGRHYYAPLLQDAFAQGWLVTEKESASESRYRVTNLDRDITVVFRPRADAGSVSVALASMTAKYVREMCMKQFNDYWLKHCPDLKPTAGYPGDAKRFLNAIEPAMKKLGIPKEAVWRKK